MATLRPPSGLRPSRGGRRSRSFGIVKIPENQPPPPDPFLLRWNELHSWQKDNQYILAHYRPVSNSYFRSFQSLFYLHNESVNIHSHLLGAFVFLFISLNVYAFEVHDVSTSDIYAFGCFFGGAIICLGTSAFYHTISNHSPKVNRLGNQLDYLGIIALITGSFLPSVYYGFYCHPSLQKLYWGMVSHWLRLQSSLDDTLNEDAFRSWVSVPVAPWCPSLPNSVRRNGGLFERQCSWPWACQRCFQCFMVSCCMAHNKWMDGLVSHGWFCKGFSTYSVRRSMPYVLWFDGISLCVVNS